MKPKWWVVILVIGFGYLSAPYFAGALKIGERRGPITHPREKRLQQLEKIRNSRLPVDFLNQLTELEARIAAGEKN